MTFQQFHYPVGADPSLFGTEARVMPDNYGFVSQLQVLEFHLDTSVRLCGESIAAAHKVFIESQDVKAIDYARVCMFDCYSQVMHNYEALRVFDPWYLNSAVESLHGDLVQVDRNICSKLSFLWTHHSSPVSHPSQSSTLSRSLSDKAEKVSRSKGKAYISKRRAELLQEIDRQQQLLESMSALVSTKTEVTTTGSSSVPLIVSTTCQSRIPSSTASSDQSCRFMSSTANDCKATVPSDHNTVFCSSMTLDIPVVSTQCSSLDETVSKNSLVHSLSTHPLSQDLISDTASRDHPDCNDSQNSIHVPSDCTKSHSSNFHIPDVFAQCSTDLENTVVSQESVHLDISPPLDSASVTQDFGESSCSVVRHGESNNSCEADNLDLCIQPDIVLDVPCSSEIASIGVHTSVCTPAHLGYDIFESSFNPVVHSHVMKVHYFSANISFVSLFRHCSLWFLILLALVIYVVFLKRMKHRSGSSVKIKVCGLELF